MKIRNDYVTNSSSSSFIIAKHKDCTEKTIYKTLLPVKKELISYLKDEYEYLDIPDELLNAIYKNDDELIGKLGLKFLAHEILESDFGEAAVEIDDWKIFAGQCSNESDDLLETFLYEYGYKINSNEYFKIG